MDHCCVFFFVLRDSLIVPSKQQVDIFIIIDYIDYMIITAHHVYHI